MRVTRATIVALAVFLATVGLAVVLQANGDAGPPPHEAIPPERAQPVGPAAELPLVTTQLAPDELNRAQEVVADLPEVRAMSGKRTQVVGAELTYTKNAACGDPDRRSCAAIGIYNYDDGYCLQVLVDLDNERALRSQRTTCSLGQEERQQARAIAEADPRVQDVIRSRGGSYVGARTVIPRSGVAGHRYVGVRYTLNNGADGVEFTVDLVKQAVCHEC